MVGVDTAKFIKFQKIEPHESAEVETTFANHINIQSPFLVKNVSTFRKGNVAYFVMELCCQGDLDKLIKKKLDHAKGIVLSENRLMKVVIQLLLGVCKLHENGILHRDLKAENVFIDSDDDVKIGDFGCIKILEGTFNYVAPEVLKSIPYDYSVDVWSLGVLFYYLTPGKLPFESNQRPNFQKECKILQFMCTFCIQIMSGEYVPLTGTECHPALQNMIHSMLHTNPDHRPTMLNLLKNPYIPCQIIIQPVAVVAAAPAGAASVETSGEVSAFIDTLTRSYPEFSVGDFRRAFAEATDRQPSLPEMSYFVRMQREHHPIADTSTDLKQNVTQRGGGGEDEDEGGEVEEEGGGEGGEGEADQITLPTPPTPAVSPFSLYAYVHPPSIAQQLYEEAEAAHSRVNLDGGNLNALEEVGRLYKKAAMAAEHENNFSLRMKCEKMAQELSRGQLLYNSVDRCVLGNNVTELQMIGRTYGEAECAAKAESNPILARKCEHGREKVVKAIGIALKSNWRRDREMVLGGGYGGYGGYSGYGSGGGGCSLGLFGGGSSLGLIGGGSSLGLLGSGSSLGRLGGHSYRRRKC